MRTITLLVTATLTLFVVTASARAAPDAADFDKPLLRFRFTVHNPGTSAKHLVKVGIRSNVLGGRWDCLSGRSEEIPDADYLVRFHVRTPETVVKADPILKLSPGATSTFTVSIIPSGTGSCGYWSAAIQAFATFDDSTTLTSTSTSISSSDVKEYEDRIPGKEELDHALRHRYAAVRAAAVRKLKNVEIDDTSLGMILNAKLKDESASVRTAAIGVIASRRVNSQVGELAKRIPLANDYEEVSALMYAVKQLKDPAFIKPMLFVMTSKPDFKEGFSVGKTLGELGAPSVPGQIVTALLKNKAAILGPKPPENTGYLLDALVQYRALSSVDLINSVLCDAADDNLVNSLTADLAGLVNSERSSDPFILGFQKCVTKNLERKYDVLRSWSYQLLLSMSSVNREMIIRRGLTDPDGFVRKNVADQVIESDKSLTESIRSLHGVAKKNSDEKRSHCYALMRLGAFPDSHHCQAE
jgi:hypothetical protein